MTSSTHEDTALNSSQYPVHCQLGRAVRCRAGRKRMWRTLLSWPVMMSTPVWLNSASWPICTSTPERQTRHSMWKPWIAFATPEYDTSASRATASTTAAASVRAAHPGDEEAEVVGLVRRHAGEMDVGADQVGLVVAADALQRRLEVVGRLAVAHSPVCSEAVTAPSGTASSILLLMTIRPDLMSGLT